MFLGGLGYWGHMPISHALLGVLVSLIWAGNFVAAKYGLMDVSPLFLTFMRFFFVSIILLPFVKLPMNKVKEIFFLSVVLGVGHFVLLFEALHLGLDVASSAVVGQLGAPFSCLLGAIVMGDVIGKWRGLGLLISFSGIIVLSGTPEINNHYSAFLMVVLAAFMWSIANLIMKKLEGVQIQQILCLMALFSAPQLFIATALIEGNPLDQLAHITPRVGASLVYTVFMSTLAGYSIWYYLLKKHPISTVAPFTLLIPVFAVALGVFLFNEQLNSMKIIGSALTIGGVGIIVIRRPKTAVQES